MGFCSGVKFVFETRSFTSVKDQFKNWILRKLIGVFWAASNSNPKMSTSRNLIHLFESFLFNLHIITFLLISNFFPIVVYALFLPSSWLSPCLFGHTDQYFLPPRQYFLILLSMNIIVNLIKNETLIEMFSFEFCKFFKNTFFTEHLQAIAWEYLYESEIISIKCRGSITNCFFVQQQSLHKRDSPVLAYMVQLLLVHVPNDFLLNPFSTRGPACFLCREISTITSISMPGVWYTKSNKFVKFVIPLFYCLFLTCYFLLCYITFSSLSF